MPQVLAFTVRGRFSAFADPSVTTHKLVYYAPPKSAIVGMIGAMTGVPRSTGNSLYSSEFVELLSRIKVGISMLGDGFVQPQKILFGINHRSTKQLKNMKPKKSELVLEPHYRIFVCGDTDILKDLKTRIDKHTYRYPVYLGHAYCHAQISDARINSAAYVEGKSMQVRSTVIEDEHDSIGITQFDTGSSYVIIENKLLHRVEKGRMEIRSLRHLIPLSGSRLRVSGIESKWQDFLCWQNSHTHKHDEVFAVF